MTDHDLLGKLQAQWRPTNQTPRTHILYEYEGERSIELSELIDDGAVLWHEMAVSNQVDDVVPLWELAGHLLAEAKQSLEQPHIKERLKQSAVDYLRFQIVSGAITPDGWSHKRFQSCKGALISAIHFHEANAAGAAGNFDRALHLIATAYYFLGISTTVPASRFFAESSARGHAEETDYQRTLVLWILGEIKGEAHLTSIEKAKDGVIDFIRRKPKLALEFEKLDKLSSSPKHNKNHDALDRLRNTLDDWAKPKGPYPEVAEAFSGFKRRKKVDTTVAPVDTTQEGSREIQIPGPECYLRFIHVRESGFVQTISLSREEPADEAA